MRRFLPFLVLATLLILSACGKPSTQVSIQPQPASDNSNYVDITFQLDPNNPTATAQFMNGVATQALQDATNDRTKITLASEAVSVTNVIHNNKRYISATFEVTNNTGKELPNLFFLARDAGNGQPFKELKAFDNSPISTIPASMVAADAKIFNSATNQMEAHKSDYKTGLDISGSSLSNKTGVFTYGFLSQNLNRTSTKIPHGAKGRVTFSVELAAISDKKNDPFSFKMTYYMASDDAAVAKQCGTGTSFTCISAIQGTGANVAITSEVTVQAIVVGDFSRDDQLKGFFLQEEDSDADADINTSEGIFIYCGNAGCGSFPTFSVGDKVEVTGTPKEYKAKSSLKDSMSQIEARVIKKISSSNPLPSAVTISLPAPLPTSDTNDFDAFDKFYEKYEGMRVSFSNTFQIAEYYQLQRFGQIVLYEGTRPFQYTHVDNTPTATEFSAHQLDLQRRRIIFDDGSTKQNPSLPSGKLFHPQPNGFGVGTQGVNFFRGGDTVSNLTGVLHSYYDAWRVQPTQASATFSAVNKRSNHINPATITGNIKVASFNVLNFFTTLDNGTNKAGPNNGDPRGAHSAAEFTRQKQKIVEALAAIDADIVGLMEIENNASASLQSLVDALNAKMGANTYAFVNTGTIGGDVIKVAFIYKPATIALYNRYQVLDTAAFTNPNNYAKPKNRPALAQSFKVLSGPDKDEIFTVVVNHLKSKGPRGAAGNDVDAKDGQASYNDTRTKGARELARWLLTDPTNSNDSDFLIIGDLNAYKGEAPITALKNSGYVDLIARDVGNAAYSFVFSGQLGYLDYALANSSLAPQVKSVHTWHINADEASAFDYNDSIRDAGERSFEAKPSGNPLFEANAFRSSDHDPVIIGLDLAGGTSTPVDTTAPTVQSLNPADNATNVAVNSTLELTFSENISKGTGNITIHKASDNSVVATIDVTSAQVTVSANKATITLSNNLVNNTDYYVHVAASSFKDAANNTFAGISDATTWNFKTVAGSSGSRPTELFISEYVEGSNNNKYIEIFNGTGADVDLSSYGLVFYANGSTSPQRTTALSGMLANNAVKVYKNSSAVLYTDADNNASVNFSGDDVIALTKNGAFVDVFGQIGARVNWGKDKTLRRKATICAGDSDASDSFDPAVQWDAFAKDDVSGLGSHTVTCP